MNPSVTQAVSQMVDYLNDTIGTPQEFLADKIKIERLVDLIFGDETWKVSAWKGNKHFPIAWYVNGNQIEADGFN